MTPHLLPSSLPRLSRSDRLLHKWVLELSDGEREGRDRVARLERLERRDLTEELEWLVRLSIPPPDP